MNTHPITNVPSERMVARAAMSNEAPCSRESIYGAARAAYRSANPALKGDLGPEWSLRWLLKRDERWKKRPNHIDLVIRLLWYVNDGATGPLQYRAWVTRRFLAHECGVSHETAKRFVADMEKRKYLRAVTSGQQDGRMAFGFTSRFATEVLGCTAADPDGSQPFPGAGGHNHDPGVGHDCDPGGGSALRTAKGVIEGVKKEEEKEDDHPGGSAAPSSSSSISSSSSMSLSVGAKDVGVGAEGQGLGHVASGTAAAEGHGARQAASGGTGGPAGRSAAPEGVQPDAAEAFLRQFEALYSAAMGKAYNGEQRDTPKVAKALQQHPAERLLAAARAMLVSDWANEAPTGPCIKMLCGKLLPTWLEQAAKRSGATAAAPAALQPVPAAADTSPLPAGIDIQIPHIDAVRQLAANPQVADIEMSTHHDAALGPNALLAYTRYTWRLYSDWYESCAGKEMGGSLLLEFLVRPQPANLVIYGGVGSGKTSMIGALLIDYVRVQRKAAAESEHTPPGRWVHAMDHTAFESRAGNTTFTSSDQFGERNPGSGATESDAFVQRLSAYPGVLWLDDCVRRDLGKVATKALAAIVEARYAWGLKTVITTNMTPAEIRTKFGEAVASRLVSGVLLHAVGDDMRHGNTNRCSGTVVAGLEPAVRMQVDAKLQAEAAELERNRLDSEAYTEKCRETIRCNAAAKEKAKAEALEEAERAAQAAEEAARRRGAGPVEARSARAAKIMDAAIAARDPELQQALASLAMREQKAAEGLRAAPCEAAEPAAVPPSAQSA